NFSSRFRPAPAPTLFPYTTLFRSVVHDGDLEPRPTWDHRVGEVADVGEIFEYVGRDAAASVADHHRVPELQFEEGRRVGSGVQARDHADRVLGDNTGPLMSAGGSEVLVSPQKWVDAGHAHGPPDLQDEL